MPTHRLLPAIPLLLALFPAAVAAQPSVPEPTWKPRPAVTHDGAAGTPRRYHAPGAPAEPAHVPFSTGDFIVEFRQPARPARQLAVTAFAARREALQQQVADFRRDLANLERGARRSLREDAGDAAGPAQITHTFSTVLHGVSVRGVGSELRNEIEALPYVAAVHVDREVWVLTEPNAEAIARTALPAAGTTSGGKGIVVAVIDTGIDYTHAALGGGFGAGFKVIGGWDFANDDSDPMDDHGHGTHVAGIIAGDGGGITGVAPGVSLLAYKVGDYSGRASSSALIAAIERTVDPNRDGDPSDHADVVNISMGGPAQEDDPAVRAVENATAAGVVFSIANGNGGNYGAVPSPGLAPSAISVGASDSQDKVAFFSSRGPTLTFGIKPEVVAPGVNILSSIPGNKLFKASGTSMAAPFVAGVAALLREQHPQWTPADVKAAIVGTSVTLQENVMTAGAGRVDAQSAARVTTLALPSVIDFGQVDTKQAVWTVSRTFTLRNVSTKAQTLTANVGGVRDGVSIRVTPSTVTLAAGETKTVSVELAVTNSAVPAPREGSGAFGGEITWSGGAVPIHLPWAFVKAAFMVVEIPDPGEVLGADVSVVWEGGGTRVPLSGPRTRVYLPLVTADVALYVLRLDEQFVVAKEQFTIEGAPVVTLPLASAQFTVAADTTDDAGRPLQRINRDCTEAVVLSLPGRKLSYEQKVRFRANRVRFSALSSRVKLYLLNRCADMATQSLYAALHEPLVGLSGNVISTLRPQWFRQEVQFAPHDATPLSVLDVAAVMRLPGSGGEDYFLDGADHNMMRGIGSSLNIYFTRSPAPEVDLVGLVNRTARCYSEEYGHEIDCLDLDGGILYLNEQKVLADLDVFPIISPMAHQVPPGQPVTFGTGPGWPRGHFDAVPGAWGAQITWFGTLGEFLFPEIRSARLSVRDAAGTIVGEGGALVLKEETLPPGRYRVESTSPTRLAPMTGRASYAGEVDTTKAETMLPVFTGMRVVDEANQPVAVVAPDSAATLLLSGADQIKMPTGGILRVPIREEMTRVEYRAHGSSEWRPLAPVVTARHYTRRFPLRGGVGTMFRVDLSTVTGQIAGAVDLRMQIEDAAGNTAQVTLEPAFIVAPATRRRSARH